MRVPRRDESFAQTSFEAFLRDRGLCDDLSWDMPTKDPPDFRLTWDNVCFAVEVTSVVNKSSVTGSPVASLTLRSSLDRFVKKLQADASRLGILHGHYVMTLGPIAELSKRSHSLREHCFEYMRQTSTVPNAPTLVLTEEPGLRWTIQKGSGTRRCVSALISDSAKFEGEVAEDIRRLLRDTIISKRDRLFRIAEPSILLVLDRYHFGDDEDWLRWGQMDATPFRGLVRIDGNGQCQVLYSSWPGLPPAV